MRSIVLIISLTMATVAARAQESGGFSIASPFSISSGRETQLLVGNTKLNDSSIVLSLPTMSFAQPSLRRDFALTYTPEVELFQEHPELNSWNQSASFRMGYRLSPRLTFATGDSFLDTKDYNRTLGDSAFVLPIGRFDENVFNSSLSYNLTPGVSLSVGFSNLASGTSLGAVSGSGLLWTMSNTTSVGVSKSLNELNRLSATYSLLSFKTLNSENQTTQNLGGVVAYPKTQNFGLTYDYGRARGLSFEISGGAIRTTRFSYAFSSSLQERLNSLDLALSFSRSVTVLRAALPGANPDAVLISTGVAEATLAGGILANSLSEVATFRMRKMLSRLFGFELRALAGKFTYLPGTPDIKSSAGRLRVYFRVSTRLSLFGGEEFFNQNFSDLIGASVARRRSFGGLIVSLDRRPQPMAKTDQDGTSEWPADWGRE